MRRPDIELTDDAARFVERHPDMIARLAGQAGRGEVSPEQFESARAGFRAYVRGRLAAARTGETEAAGQAFLDRFATS